VRIGWLGTSVLFETDDTRREFRGRGGGWGSKRKSCHRHLRLGRWPEGCGRRLKWYRRHVHSEGVVPVYRVAIGLGVGVGGIGQLVRPLIGFVWFHGFWFLVVRSQRGICRSTSILMANMISLYE
jgi:hypothetical protein